MVKIQMERRGTALHPADPYSLERLMDIPAGAALNVTISKAARQGKMALYWAGLGTLLENFDDEDRRRWPTTRHIHNAMMEALGFMEKIWRIDGTFRNVPNSIAIDNMEDAAFEEVFERIRQAVIDTWGYDPWDEWVAKKEQQERERKAARKQWGP